MFCAMFCLLKSLFEPKVRICIAALFAAALPAVCGDTVELVILASADLHGCKAQLRKAIAPVVQKQMHRAPDRTIYVDTGDCAQGSLSMLLQKGSGMLPELYRAGCTVFVPGNHELEYGFEAFKNILGEFRGTVLAANLYAPELAGSFSDSVVMEKAGVKIAFIGLMLKNMENSFPVAENRFRTLPGSAVLRKAVNKVRRQGADVIVLLRHAGEFGGGENTIDLIKHVPEIDLIIGAHNHKANAGSQLGRAWYVQPPAHGKALADVRIIFDRRRRRIKQIKSSLIELKSYKEKSAVDNPAVPAWTGKTMDFPAEVMRRKFNADLAVYAVTQIEKLQRFLNNPQPLLEDLYRVFPYYDPIITVKVSAGEFGAIFREYVKFTHKRKQYLAKSGFTAVVVRNKVRDIVLAPDKQFYTLAISAYAAAGAGGNLPDTGRILKKRIDYRQTENAPGILELLRK